MRNSVPPATASGLLGAIAFLFGVLQMLGEFRAILFLEVRAAGDGRQILNGLARRRAVALRLAALACLTLLVDRLQRGFVFLFFFSRQVAVTDGGGQVLTKRMVSLRPYQIKSFASSRRAWPSSMCTTRSRFNFSALNAPIGR